MHLLWKGWILILKMAKLSYVIEQQKCCTFFTVIFALILDNNLQISALARCFILFQKKMFAEGSVNDVCACTSNPIWAKTQASHSSQCCSKQSFFLLLNLCQWEQISLKWSSQAHSCGTSCSDVLFASGHKSEESCLKARRSETACFKCGGHQSPV